MTWKKSPQGERAVRFIKNLTLVGQYSEQPFNLLPWQEDFIRQLFGTVDDKGKLTYNDCFLFIPRKNGKSTLGAAIALYCLLGLNLKGQNIYSAAADRNQASLIFDFAVQMIGADPYLSSITEIYHSRKTILCPNLHNKYVVLSSEARRQYGLDPSVVLLDELLAQTNTDLWSALTTGSGTRDNFLMLAISTAGTDLNSLCYQQYSYACSVRDRTIDNPNYLPVIFEAKPEQDWTSPTTWKAANPSLGSHLKLDYLEKKCRVAKDQPTEENAFKQFYLNLWVQDNAKLIPRDKWEACGKTTLDLESLEGKDCFGGIDLSTINDITAFVLVFPDLDEGTYQVLPFFWIPKDNATKRQKRDRVPYLSWAKKGLITLTDGDVIDYSVVRKDINAICEKYNVRKIFIDPHNATQIALQLRDEDGLIVEQFAQSITWLNAPTKELLRLVLAKKLHHGNNKVLTWMADNCIGRSDANDNIRIDKQKSREKVDGISALINALAAAMGDCFPSQEMKMDWVSD